MARTILFRYTAENWILASNDDGKTLVLPRSEWFTDSIPQLGAAVIQVLAESYEDNEIIRVEYILDHENMNIEEYNALCSDFAHISKHSTLNLVWYSANHFKSEDQWLSLNQKLIEYENAHGVSLHSENPKYNPELLEKRRSEPVTIATDGSQNRRSGLSSWAFVPSEETCDNLITSSQRSKFPSYFYKAGSLNSMNIEEVETLALIKAFKWARKKSRGKITLQTDSIHAICFLKDPSSKIEFSNIKGEDRYSIVDLKNEVANGSVILEKVKAHSDHELNNRADCVAFAFRRATKSKMPPIERHLYVSRALKNMELEEVEAA